MYNCSYGKSIVGKLLRRIKIALDSSHRGNKQDLKFLKMFHKQTTTN